MLKKYRVKHLGRSLGGNIALTTLLVLMATFFVIPLIFSLVNSLKPIEELFIFPPRLYVSNPTLSNFSGLFSLMSNSAVPFTRYFLNSALLTVAVTVGNIIISSAAAYPLSKGKFYGQKAIFSFIVTALLFSTQVTGVQQYIVISKLNFLDTYWAIILPALSGSMGVFLMKQFMDGIPDSLIEAAQIDGCKEYGILFRIILPNVKPAWLTLAIFTFQATWGTNGSGLIFTEELKFLPTAMSQITSGTSIARVGITAATAVLMMIPPILFFILSQSNVLETMSSAGIKE